MTSHQYVGLLLAVLWVALVCFLCIGHSKRRKTEPEPPPKPKQVLSVLQFLERGQRIPHCRLFATDCKDVGDGLDEITAIDGRSRKVTITSPIMFNREYVELHNMYVHDEVNLWLTHKPCMI
ncbi:hypothetical protein VPHK469_0079 [Vibrio phage K469]